MDTYGERLRALRKRLNLSQDDVAARAGPDFRRDYVTKAETGANKLRSADIRIALAKGLGLSRDDLERYLEGELPLDEAVALAKAPRAEKGPRVVREPTAPEPDDQASALERALFPAMASGRFEPADFDAARQTIRETFRYLREGVDEGEVARGFLEAARQLREEGKATTAAAVSARAFSSRHPDLQRKLAALEAGDEADRRARIEADGGDPDHIPEAVRAAQERDRKRRARERGE
jgi:transcriptional regulator with XRE-family HTH domain